MSADKIKRILLRLPNWLGDSVMISPTFEWLKQSFKNAEFSIIGTKASCGIYERDKRISAIYIDDTKGAKSRILATYKLAQTIGAHDVAITFSNSFFSALLLYFTKTPIRIGYARNARSMLLTNAMPLKKYDSCGNKHHQVLLYLALIAPLKAVIAQVSAESAKNIAPNVLDSSIFSFSTAPTILPLLATKPLTLISHKMPKATDSSPKIGINPGAAYGSAKRWEEAHFITTITHFLKQGYFVYLFGAESGANANIAKAIALDSSLNSAHFVDLSDKTTINELIDYIASMDVFITNDSGPMHIATALNVPLVAIFGPTDINETAPFSPLNVKYGAESADSSNPRQILLCKHLPCAPCKKRVCPLKHHNCMKQILPSEVISATTALLSPTLANKEVI